MKKIFSLVFENRTDSSAWGVISAQNGLKAKSRLKPTLSSVFVFSFNSIKYISTLKWETGRPLPLLPHSPPYPISLAFSHFNLFDPLHAHCTPVIYHSQIHSSVLSIFIWCLLRTHSTSCLHAFMLLHMLVVFCVISFAPISIWWILSSLCCRSYATTSATLFPIT